MNCWLIQTGEPVPVGIHTDDRLMRTGLIAQTLVEKGHAVRWWSSTFSHSRKEQMFERDTVIELQPGLAVHLLHGRAYNRNISLARIRNHRELARRFLMQVANLPPPDIIVCSLPTIELCDAATAFGAERGIPVVLDMRDMWPDIFADHFHPLLRPGIRAATWPLYRQARRACRRATAIIGITDEFVDWGIARTGRSRTDWDRTFPLAYPARVPGDLEIEAAGRFWDAQGVRAGDGIFQLCFAGTLGRQLDLDTVIEASRALEAIGVDHQMVICGTGERLAHYQLRAQELKSVLLPGWVGASQLHVLLRRSQAGLDPMPSRYDFLASINNKAIEYLSAGLPVISCPREGALHRFLQKEGCGESYAYGDVQGLARLVQALRGHPERLRKMADQAAKAYNACFVAEKVYAELEAHLQLIIARASRASG